MDQLGLFDLPDDTPEPEPVLAKKRTDPAVPLHELPAPVIFSPEPVGMAARQAAYAAWVEQYGRFDAARRSRAWRPSFVQPEQPAYERCRVSVLYADLHCEHWPDRRTSPCQCVGSGHLHRGACRRCPWEGPIRTDESPAIEDAHDHAWPGWRDLPAVEKDPGGKKHAAWLAALYEAYTRDWIDAGGPIRTLRNPGLARHVPGAAPGGGYDMACMRDVAAPAGAA